MRPAMPKSAAVALGAAALLLALGLPAAMTGVLDPVRDWWQAAEIEELRQLGEMLASRETQLAELGRRFAETDELSRRHDRLAAQLGKPVGGEKPAGAWKPLEPHPAAPPLDPALLAEVRAGDAKRHTLDQKVAGQRKEIDRLRRGFYNGLVSGVREYNADVARAQELSAQVRPAWRVAAAPLPQPSPFVGRP